MEKCPLAVLRPRSGGSRRRAIEEDIRKLLGGIEVEGLADRLEDLVSRSRLMRALSSFGKFLEEGQVEQDAGHFHIGQAGDQRHLDLVHQF